MRITIDTEGAEYNPFELLTLSQEIQECWMNLGRGSSEVFTMNCDTSKYQETLKQEQESKMLNASTGDV